MLIETYPWWLFWHTWNEAVIRSKKMGQLICCFVWLNQIHINFPKWLYTIGTNRGLDLIFHKEKYVPNAAQTLPRAIKFRFTSIWGLFKPRINSFNTKTILNRLNTSTNASQLNPNNDLICLTSVCLWKNAILIDDALKAYTSSIQ